MFQLKKIPIHANWPVWIPLCGLGAYSILVQALAGLWPVIKIWKTELGFAAMAVLLIALSRLRGFSTKDIGLSGGHWRQNALLGAGAGLVVLLVPPGLDGLIQNTSLASEPLFLGAESRSLERTPPDFRLFLEVLILAPLVVQVAVTGFLLSPLLRFYNPAWAYLAGSLFFPLALGQPSVGIMGLGIVSAQFYRVTGSLIAPLVFQGFCGLSGLLMVYAYPRAVTFLGLVL